MADAAKQIRLSVWRAAREVVEDFPTEARAVAKRLDDSIEQCCAERDPCHTCQVAIVVAAAILSGERL